MVSNLNAHNLTEFIDIIIHTNKQIVIIDQQTNRTDHPPDVDYDDDIHPIFMDGDGPGYGYGYGNNDGDGLCPYVIADMYDITGGDGIGFSDPDYFDLD